MSLFELQGIPVVSGTITLPRAGRWIADLDLDAEPPGLGLPVTLRGPGLALVGHVARRGSFHGAYRVRVAGGTGGLLQTIPAVAYRNMPVSLLLGEVLGPVGERLSSQVDASVTSRSLATWVRPAGLAGAALTDLAELVGALWRALPDGSIWLGSDTWTTSGLVGQVFDADPLSRRLSIALDSAALLPGQTWQGHRVEAVVHTISGTGFRTEIATQ